jgi:hypothetical protein
MSILVSRTYVRPHRWRVLLALLALVAAVVLGAGTTVRTVRADADGGWIQYCTVNAYHITADGYADGVRTGDPDIWTSGHYFATPYYCNSDGFQWGGYIYDIKYYGYSGTYICGLYDVYNNPGENVFTYC